MITRRNEAKTLVRDVSCGFKCKSNSSACNSNQKWNNEKCQREYKKYWTCKKGYSWNPSACIFENRKYLKGLVDTSVIVCDDIINATDSVSTNVANTVPTNMKNSMSTCQQYCVKIFHNKIEI